MPKFEIHYHKRNDAIYNRYHVKDCNNPAQMCEWIHDRMVKGLIDYYEIRQVSLCEPGNWHDVTSVYQPIIESGLSVLQVKDVNHG